MPTWNDRRWGRQRGDDNAAFGERSAPRRWNDDRDPDRDDVHAGPWSPYNGLARDRADDRRSHDRDRDRERGTWGPRGRDYWLENDQDMTAPRDWSERREDLSRGPENRWEDRRLGMGDRWRRGDDDNSGLGNEQWGNTMGLRDEPSERAVPRSGAWQHEPRYGEMERLWSDVDDHPWANQEHDEIQREARGEQYPSHTHGSWRDERDRGWREERPRDDRRGGWNEQRYAEPRGAQRHERGEPRGAQGHERGEPRGAQRHERGEPRGAQRYERGEPRFDEPRGEQRYAGTRFAEPRGEQRYAEQRYSDQRYGEPRGGPRYGTEQRDWAERTYQRGHDEPRDPGRGYASHDRDMRGGQRRDETRRGEPRGPYEHEHPGDRDDRRRAGDPGRDRHRRR